MKASHSKGFSPFGKAQGKTHSSRFLQDISVLDAAVTNAHATNEVVIEDISVLDAAVTNAHATNEVVIDAPSHIDPKHYKEWLDSAVDEEVIALNIKSLSGNSPYDYLFYSSAIDRRNDGRVTEGTLKRYRHVENGGWWVDGIDLQTFEDGLWGQFKPNTPRQDSEGKTVKYEAPLKVPTEIIALRIPDQIWELIARRYDTQLPENYQSLPLGAFWEWVIAHLQIPVIVCEGAKKAAALISCGYVAIALPGINNGYRQPKDEFGEPSGLASLIPQLQVFAQSGRRIYLCFDQDQKRKTIRAVNGAIAKTGKLFIKEGCEVGVMSWHPTLGKGIDDVIMSHGWEQFDEIYRATLTFQQWQTHQLKRLTYPVDLLLNQRYLGEFTPPPNKQFICLKAPKGTGKTEWLAWFTDPVIRSGERRILLITHRVQLSTQSANRLGIPYITESSEQGRHFGMGMCIDSLHPNSQARFNPDDWKGAWIIFDEIQQVIWHLLNSRTCQKERVSIIKTLKKLLQIVISTGGKILIADADLNDISIDFIKGLLGIDIEPWILVNEYQFQESWKVYHFADKNPARLVKSLENKLEIGEKHLLCVSGQKAKSRWGSRNLEAQINKDLPYLRILRIDSETVSDPKHPAFGCTNNLNEVIKNYDLVICTPTIETGVSIEEKHFDGVWGIFQGVQTTDGVRQHLSRYRLPVPRYVWIKEFGINRVGNSATTVKGLLSGEYKKDKANINRLTSIGFEESIDGNFEPTCLTTWAKLGAIINLGMINYQQQILDDLKAEGHHVLEASDLDILPDENEAEDFKEDITKTCEAQYLIYRESVSTADSIDKDKYEKLEKQQSKTQDEQLQYRKGQLERRYNVPVTANLVEKDDKKWYSQIELHYYFDKGREFLNDRDKEKMSKALSNGDGDYFIPDTNKSLIGKKIDILDWLGFKELLEIDKISNKHDLAKRIFEKAEKNFHNFTELGVDLRAKTPMLVCQKLVGLIGYKLPPLRREGKRGDRERIYGQPVADYERETPANSKAKRKKTKLDANGKAIPILDGREEVLTAWFERDTQVAEKAVEKLAAEKLATEKLETVKNEGVTTTSSAIATEEIDEWLSLENLTSMAEDFQRCKHSNDLFLYLGTCPKRAIEAAVKLLPVEFGQWVMDWFNWWWQQEEQGLQYE